MAKSPRKTGDPLLSSNESEDAIHRREFAQKFPPNTPHSVINHFYAQEHETQLATIADPRELKTVDTPLGVVVESAPGVMPAPNAENMTETPRKSRRKSRKAAKSTSETTAKTEEAKV